MDGAPRAFGGKRRVDDLASCQREVVTMTIRAVGRIGRITSVLKMPAAGPHHTAASGSVRALVVLVTLIGAVLAGTPPAAADAVLTVTPSVNLPWQQGVAITGRGFPPFDEVGLAECLTASDDTTGCDMSSVAVTTAAASGELTASLTVRRQIATSLGAFDCARVSCSIGSGSLSGGPPIAKAAITFDPSSYAVALSRDTDLVEGQVVEVRAGGFSPGVTVSILQCPPGWNGGYGCFVIDGGRTDSDGRVGATPFVVHRVLWNAATGESFDCSVTVTPCTIGVIMSQSPYNEYSTHPITVRARDGYWMLGAKGDVYAFGDAAALGSPTGIRATNIASTPSGNGYWVTNAAGAVFTFGDAVDLGGTPLLRPGEEVSSISSNPRGNGYWLFTSQGRVFAYGAARHFGDMAGTRLNGRVLGSVATPSGGGYYMVASDGGIFTFGDAVFHGSMGDTKLNGPVVGLAPDPDRVGYWLVASDGGIFSFDANFMGSMGDVHLNSPVAGMVAYGDGYLMVGGDGGIFDFSSKPFVGSLGDKPPADPIIAVAPLNG
jgi:hypothetical protein